MNENKFNSTLKACICAMYQGGRVSKVDSIQGYGLSEKSQEILKQLAELVMNTEYFKKDTKKYLANKYQSLRASAMGNCSGENQNTVMSRIRYDLSKLKAALGEDSLMIIVKQPQADLTLYERKLNDLHVKHGKKSLLEGFAIRLPGAAEMTTVITAEQQEQLLQLAEHHSKKARQNAEKLFTPALVGYIRYLEQHEDTLSKDEHHVYRELCEWLK